jgi:ABC-2 type transport system permease protein
MRKVFVLARRELAAYFFSPMAYAVGALFLCACGLKFVAFPGSTAEWFIMVPGRGVSLRPLFDMMATAMIVAGPMLTMRLISEEVRSGTIETLLTAAVTDTQVILGKFLGVLGFYAALLGGTLPLVIVMAIFARPDWSVALMGYFGMLLLGAAFLAVGLFASTLTKHQLLSAVVSFAILAVFGFLMQQLVPVAPEPLNEFASQVNVMNYFKDFSGGRPDLRGLVFFLAATGLFLFLSVKTLESRRWR